MAVERLTLDTNLLFYAIDNTAGEKHEIASALLRSAVSKDAVLLLQTFVELYNAVRKRRTISGEYTESFLRRNATLFPLVAVTTADLWAAIPIQRRHQIQVWDAMLLATALRAGCTVLLSEDMQHNHDYDGIVVLNPFKLTSLDLARLVS